MNNILRSFCVFTFMFIISSTAYADEFIQWHSTNIQVLRGETYEVGESDRTLVTLEHANEWKYGSFFMFVDVTWPDSGKTNYYAEFSPDFSLGKILNKDLSVGPIKDFYIATTIEKPKDQTERYLYGAGVSVDVPGFTFLKLYTYLRDNRNLKGDTYQVTVAWKRPIEVGKMNFLFEGFADFAGKEDTAVSNELIVPRFLVDTGKMLGLKEKTLWTGIEYQYWNNKFGISGLSESVVQLQSKWVF